MRGAEGDDPGDQLRVGGGERPGGDSGGGVGDQVHPRVAGEGAGAVHDPAELCLQAQRVGALVGEVDCVRRGDRPGFGEVDRHRVDAGNPQVEVRVGGVLRVDLGEQRAPGPVVGERCRHEQDAPVVGRRGGVQLVTDLGDGVRVAGQVLVGAGQRLPHLPSRADRDLGPVRYDAVAVGAPAGEGVHRVAECLRFAPVQRRGRGGQRFGGDPQPLEERGAGFRVEEVAGVSVDPSRSRARFRGPQEQVDAVVGGQHQPPRVLLGSPTGWQGRQDCGVEGVGAAQHGGQPAQRGHRERGPVAGDADGELSQLVAQRGHRVAQQRGEIVVGAAGQQHRPVAGQ
ncbi:hypothetical protein, partial [Micromonospora sp. 4G55]|uniref:hypothetical protein n=1 Tax=Micromonospora sp. 4G55 TaxID=2806102 RepID=UPI001EE48337